MAPDVLALGPKGGRSGGWVGAVNPETLQPLNPTTLNPKPETTLHPKPQTLNPRQL